jgi:hypothetical protein
MKKHMNHPRPIIKPAWLPEMDRLLLLGMKHGQEGIQLVRKRLKQLNPALTPGEIWKRMRALRENGCKGHRDPRQWPPELIQLLKDGYSNGGTSKKEALKTCRECYPGLPSYVISRFARRQGWLVPAPRMAARRQRAWSEPEDQLLWTLAGYESPQHIACKLKRTEGAVRCRLKGQGLSGKVKDGISLRAFQEMFHIGHRRIYTLIAHNMLRVRDARITATSVAALREQLDPTQKVPVVNCTGTIPDALSWKRVASLLETSLDEVRMWLARRQLRVVDTFVTEKALEEFCRRCNRNGGPKLNYRLLDPKVLDWLKDYGITIPTREMKSSVSGFEKHAFLTRVCRECGRSIRGNAYFIHIRACKGPVIGDPKVLGPIAGMPGAAPRSAYQPRLSR